jgi:hypothetical protein
MIKAKYLPVLAALILFGCEDNTGGLGLSVLPGSDGVAVKVAKFDVRTESAVVDSVFAKTEVGYIGRFTDNEYGFGRYEGSLLTEFNCVDDLTFPQPYDKEKNPTALNMISSDLDKSFYLAYLSIGYETYFGDSIAPMQIGVYELDKKLDKNHYTNIDPTKYVKKDGLLGTQTFTAVDQSDSTRWESGHIYTTTVKLPDELGKYLIRENWEHPEYFKNSDTFVDNVFKGVYIKPEVGDGAVIYAKYLTLSVVFNSYAVDTLGNICQKYDESGDSIIQYSRSFVSTMEVVQANHFDNSEQIKAKAEEKNHTYLKTPAGIFTRIILPVAEMRNKLNLSNDTINTVKLSLDCYYHAAKNAFSMNPPSEVLLLKEKNLKSFFESNELPDSYSSYYTTFGTNQYVFGNITRLVVSSIGQMDKDEAEAKKEAGADWSAEKQTQWETQWEKDNALLLVPVAISSTTDATYGNSYTIGIAHDLKPAFAEIKGGDPNEGGSLISIDVVYSEFNK